MSNNLGNTILIASSATFTLLIFQAFAAAPPIDKPLYSPQLLQPQMLNTDASNHDQAQPNQATGNQPAVNY